MMDYDKLIEQLNAWNEQHLSVVCGSKHFACDYLCENEDCIVVRAATALSTLQAENEKLRNEVERQRRSADDRKHLYENAERAYMKVVAELEQVKRERDAAIADIAAILAEVEEIHRGYGVDNADADNAFADLCRNYCAKNGNACYKEAEDYRCKNFMWRGMRED